MIVDCADDGEYTAYKCNECGSIMRYHFDCKRRVCFSCNVKRSKKLVDKYRNVDEYLIQGNTFFATFTLKNTVDVVDGVQRIRKAFKDLLRRHPYNVWFAGGMYAIECELNKDDGTFNIHIHACIDSAIDVKKCYWFFWVDDVTEEDGGHFEGIKQDWYEVTGDSYVIGWDETRYPDSAISYCMKYSTKQVDYADRIDDVEKAMHGIRMLSFFGVIYNFKGFVYKREFLCLCCRSDDIVFYFHGNVADSKMGVIQHSLSNGFG